MRDKKVRLMGLLVAGASGVAGAQTVSGIEEVVVTSRRVAEKLVDVPVSITAFTTADLEKQAIRNTRDLAGVTPNLTFSSGDNGRAAVPVVRGIGLIDGRGFDNAVGIFIDGIFVSGRGLQNVGMLDLERVEVIKGPQSALYGRNTFSGAINYVTRPTPDTFSAKADVTFGTDQLVRFTGSVGGPITERTSARIAINYEDDDGTYENAGPAGAGDGIGGVRNKSALLSLRFQPSSDVMIDVGGLWSKERADSFPVTITPNNCGQYDPALNRNATSSDLVSPLYFCGEGLPSATDRISISPAAYAYDNETKRGTLALQWDLPGVSIQSLNAYTTVTSTSGVDLDRTQAGDSGYGYLPLSVYRAAGSPATIFSGTQAALFNQIRAGTFNTYYSTATNDGQYWSSELRFTGPRDRKLRWLGGLFYFNSWNDDTSILGIDASPAVAALGLQPSEIQFLVLDTGSIIPGLAPRGLAVRSPVYPPNVSFLNGPGSVLVTWNPLENTQKSAFGSLEYDFTDRLTGTAELRYTKEQQRLSNAYDIFFASTGSYSSSSSFTDPRLTLRYKPSADVTMYASAARGTRSGGLNAAVTDPVLVRFDPEKNDTYEVGLKRSFADGRVLLSAAAFWIDWTDAQFRQTVPSSTPGAILTATTNAGDIESKGIEASIAARLSERWRVDVAVGYSDPKFAQGTLSATLANLCRTLPASRSQFPVIPITCVSRDVDGNGTIDLTQPDIGGAQLPRTSKVTGFVGIEFNAPLRGDSRFTARLDTSYRSKQYQDFINVQYIPARTLMNLRFGLEQPSWDAILWVENLTDDDTPDQLQGAFSQNFNSLSSRTSVVNAAQRRVGITARYRF